MDIYAPLSPLERSMLEVPPIIMPFAKREQLFGRDINDHFDTVQALEIVDENIGNPIATVTL